MKRQRPKTHAAAVATVVVALAAGGAVAGTIRLVGDTQAVWLIAPADGGYQLAVKPLDKPWMSPWPAKTGQISTATAVGDSAVIFFAGGGHVRYFPDQLTGLTGVNAPQRLWPAATVAVAACPAGGEVFDAVLVLIQNLTSGLSLVQPATLPTTSTTQSADPAGVATAPATSAPAARGPLALLRYAGQEWRQLAVVPSRFVRPPLRAHIARDEQAVYLLLDQKPEPVLIAWDGGAWQEVDLPADLGGSRPLALLSMPEGIALASFSAQGRTGISRRVAGRWTRRQIVRRDDDDAIWLADAPPAVARLEKSLALVWQAGDEWSFATCGSDGKISPKTEKIFGNGLAAADAMRILQHFFVGVVIVFVALMFWPGQPLRAAPFSLPPTIIPARLDKRVLAFVIDALPFLILASLVLGKVDETELTWERIRSGNVPSLVYWYLVFLGSYPLYCILMEARFAATVGKMAMRLRVVGDGGRRASAREIALRNVTKIPELMAMIAVIPILFPILTRYRQRLGDKIAWTTVIDAEASLPPEIMEDAAEKPGAADESDEQGRP